MTILLKTVRSIVWYLYVDDLIQDLATLYIAVHLKFQKTETELFCVDKKVHRFLLTYPIFIFMRIFTL